MQPIKGLHEGWLYKKGQNINSFWKKRYFVFTNTSLEYRKSDNLSDPPKGAIPLRRFGLEVLSDEADENGVDLSKKARCQFNVATPGRTYYLRAETEADKETWLQALRDFEVNVDDQEGNTVAEYVPDNAAIHCARCKAPFGLTRRRHRCLKCGFVYCNQPLCYDMQEKLCLTCQGTGMDLGAVNLKAANCNLLLQVVAARDLKAMDRGGTSDPYVVIFFENKKYRTKTIFKELNPEYGQKFFIPVTGISRSFQVALFDQDTYSYDDFLGMVHIPLADLECDRIYDEWFQLGGRPSSKGNSPSEDDVSGAVHLRFIYSYSVRSLLAPIPDGKDEKTALSPALFGNNISRAQTLYHSLQIGWWKSQISLILSWQRPMLSLFMLVIWCLTCLLYPIEWIPPLLPALLIFQLSANYIDRKYNLGRNPFLNKDDSSLVNPTRDNSGVGVQDEEEDDDDDENDNDNDQDHKEAGEGDRDEKDKNEKMGFFGKLRKYKNSVRDVQNQLGEVCDKLEQVQSVLWWRDPTRSMVLLRLCIIAFIALCVLPIRLLLLVGGVHKLTKNIRKRNSVPVDELGNFIGRAATKNDVSPSFHSLPQQLMEA